MRKDGYVYHPDYYIWAGMKQRCNNPKTASWKYYGGKGVKVCEAWNAPDGFKAFLADMGPRPDPSYSIHRLDSSKDYEPGNCKWATDKEQMAFKRTIVSDIAEEFGISLSSAWARVHIKRGKRGDHLKGKKWSEERRAQLSLSQKRRRLREKVERITLELKEVVENS